MKNNFKIPTIDKKELIGAEYLFIDGISRSGKGALAPFISSLKNVEHFKSNYNFDRLIFLYETKKLTDDAFRYLLETDLIMDTWFTMIGRNQNTNKHDLTSILNSPKFELYKKRENIQDNPETFLQLENKILSNKTKFTYITDDFIIHKKLIKKIVNNSKFIVSVRNPIELIFAWERSGRGLRFGNDKRFLHPTFSKGNINNVPYYAINDMKQYHNYSSLEKCTYSIINLQKKYYEAYNLSSKDIVWLSFEKVLIDPLNNFKRLFSFLGQKNFNVSDNLLENARIPRKICKKTHEKKARIIFSNVNKALKANLLKLCNFHIELFGNTYDVDYNKLSIEYEEYKDFKSISPNPQYIKGKRIN